VAAEGLRFGRRIIVPDVVLALGELAVIGYPLYDAYTLDEAQKRVFLESAPLAILLAGAVWYLALRAWLAPLFRAARRRLAGEVLDPDARALAYEAIVRFPQRALGLRVALFFACGLTLVLLLHLRPGFPLESVMTVVAICTAHAFGVSTFRALWYTRILEVARAGVLPDLDSLRLFADGYRRHLVLAALATGTLGIGAIGVFTWYFIPINLEHYLRLETWFPITIAVLTGIWYLYERRLPRPIDRYLEAALSPKPADQPTREDPRAVVAYRAAQTLPYRLALSKIAFWLVAEALLVLQCVLFFAVDFENAALMGGEAIVVTIGVALYEALWHRATMRPLLTHVAARHRPSPEKIRTPLSLRSKMFAGFGALAVFACGLSLFWSFMQYKSLATVFIQRESDVRLDALLQKLQQQPELDTARILAVLEESATQFAPPGSYHAVLYYLPPDANARPSAVGGPKEGPPPLPWAGEALLRRLDRGHMELSGLQLTGAYARLYLPTGRDAGAIALLLPNYRGRGPSTAPQIRILVSFFLVLLIGTIGIVILLANDLTGPLRDLERRADAMARGDLTRPVVSAAGEGDEVGRLTFAFEEMRRALNDKLRSSTEINLSLEAEVTRRTAELERRNNELKSALDQLQRAQDELVRSEKMASMGRLVAGIAHEINNPVNAVVNTAGPLEATLEDIAGKEGRIDGDAVRDVKEMIRVIQRGARRTKEIVQALHNYSRGDDDRVVEVDLQRSIDETLDLLRHHLKNGITVERQYGDVGRVRGRTTLNQVFMNLLTNAAQALGTRQEATGQGGTIAIKTARKDSKVVITVTDDGPGIPPDVLPRIFDPFFTTKDVGEGSGLGLSIVHGIVERHGGTIAVDSEVGRGTSFTITLPSPGDDPGDPGHSIPAVDRAS
jgi:signal transduction histidine kinase